MELNSQLIINNEYFNGQEDDITIDSPWDNNHLATIAAANNEQVDYALSSANESFVDWRYSNISERIEIAQNAVKLLRADTNHLSELLHKEIGKFPEDAKSEISRSIDYIELVISGVKHIKGSMYYGDSFDKYPRLRKTGFYNRVPLGVILAISPFNYPINLSITKIAPALLSGNTVVLKPPTQGALTSYHFYQKFIEAGLPNGVLNLVSGRSRSIGDQLLTDERVSLVAFTGSTGVGNHIRKVTNGIPLLMELGGKDFGIVTENANLDLAVGEIVKGAFSYCGQRCTAQKMVLAHHNIADELAVKLKEASKDTKTNPMIDQDAADFVMELIEDARSKGASFLIEPIQNNNNLSISIADNVTKDMRLFKEEQFGPIMPIARYEDDEEAISLANSSDFGLQASIYTKNIDQAFKMADKIDVGTVQINGRPDRGPDNFPFGGVKDSGQFMQGTIETINLMTRGKLTVLNIH